MEEIETILVNKRESLKEQLNSTKRELEVITLIKAFDFEITKPSGKVFYDIKVSPEAMNEFIGLLKPEEYVQGFNIDNCYRVDCEQYNKLFNTYLLIYKDEYLLNFSYDVTKYNESYSVFKKEKRTEVSASCYYEKINDYYFINDSQYVRRYLRYVQSLRVLHAPNGDFSGCRIIDGYPWGEITHINNVDGNPFIKDKTRVEDALTSISSEILMERYLEKFQKQNEKSRVRK